MQSSDWMHFAGPIGIYYIEMTDLHPRYKLVFQDLLRCFYGMRYHALNTHDLIDPSGQEEYDVLKWYRECAVILEYLMPINYNHINQHVWQHAVSELIYAGPVFGHHMFPFEAGAGWLKKLLHSPKSPEEGLARAIASEWRTMLHKYDDQNVEAIVQRLLAPKFRGHSGRDVVVQTVSYPACLPQAKPKDSAVTRAQINADNVAEVLMLHSYFRENDAVCKIVEEEFRRAKGPTWKQFDVTTWVVSDESLGRIDQQHRAAHRGQGITRAQVEYARAGPVADAIITYKKIRINDTDFCDVVTDANFKTTNCCVRYSVNNGKNEWSYARIKRIYCVLPYKGATQAVTLFRLINYRKPRSYGSGEDSSGLVPLELMTDVQVDASDDHLFLVPVKPECAIDDENLAFWPALRDPNADDQAPLEYFAVNYNTLKLHPDSLGPNN
jgi:hypothetical protein